MKVADLHRMFKDRGFAEKVVKGIKELEIKRKTKIMHVCGTHEQTITKHGIRAMLPENVEVVAGPGCPVCITPAGEVDEAVALAEQGQIVVTSSNLGLKTSARASIYAAAKHAVQAMVWSLREELRDTMVKAATINPGSVSTPWFDGKEVDRSKMLTADDVARAVRLIIDQDATSNIDHILLLPGKT